MKLSIGGFQKLTLLDYPNKVSCLIFLNNCNFNCKYCHNQTLIQQDKIKDNISFELIKTYLIKRKNIIEGVCISGGEPTIYKDLPILIEKIKNMGYLVKLDTNGTNYEMLDFLINNKLIDYVAMDIKNSLDKYENTANSFVNIGEIIKSINLLLENKIDYEFRTTIMLEEHNLNDFKKIGQLINNANYYYLQCFKSTEELNKKNINFTPPDKKFLSEIQFILKDNIKNIIIRE